MQQVLIIGLGQFGMALARSLADKGCEVLAVDRRQDLVEDISPHVAEAITADAADEEALAHLHPERRDVAVCAIGEDNKEASIICTALLRQMGAPRVVSRAGNPLHARILRLVGAHQVVHPEEEFGQRLASRLAYQNIVSDMPLGEDLQLTEIAIPESFVGKSLMELALPRRYGIMVVAVRRGTPSAVTVPDPQQPLATNDKLVVVSSPSAIPKLFKEA